LHFLTFFIIYLLTYYSIYKCFKQWLSSLKNRINVSKRKIVKMNISGYLQRRIEQERSLSNLTFNVDLRNNEEIYALLLTISSQTSIEQIAAILNVDVWKVRNMILCFGNKVPTIAFKVQPVFHLVEKLFNAIFLSVLLLLSICGNLSLLFYLKPFSLKAFLKRHCSWMFKNDLAYINKTLSDRHNHQCSTSTCNSTTNITQLLFWLCALFDLIFSIFVTPFQIITTLNDGLWIFNEITCKLYAYLTYVILCFTSLSIITVSLDRYLSIFFDLRYSTNKKFVFIKHIQKVMGSISFKTYIFIFLVILSSFLFSLPYLIYTTNAMVVNGTTCVDVTRHFICLNRWNDVIEENVFKIVFILLIFVLPGLLLAYSYGSICFKLFFKKNISIENKLTQAHAASSNTNKKRRRIVKILILDCLFYIVCWFPISGWTLSKCINVLLHIFDLDITKEISIFNYLYLGLITNVSLKWIFRLFNYWSKIKDLFERIFFKFQSFFHLRNKTSPMTSPLSSNDLNQQKNELQKIIKPRPNTSNVAVRHFKLTENNIYTIYS